MALQAQKVSRAFVKQAPGLGRCIVSLSKTPYSHSASLQPGVQMSPSKFIVGGSVTLEWTGISSRGWVKGKG